MQMSDWAKDEKRELLLGRRSTDRNDLIWVFVIAFTIGYAFAVAVATL